METKEVKEKKEVTGRSLIDLVFSWPIKDVLNKDLYKEKVKQIPKTFSSSQEYLESYINPLIEETRADLCSSLTTLSESLCFEINSLEPSRDFNPPKHLYYKIQLKKGKVKKKRDDDDDEDDDEHGVGDLIAITNVRPKSVGDLERPGRPYLIAFVHGWDERSLKLSIQSSKLIPIEDDIEKNEKQEVLYAVSLINMTTNLRIWSALHSDPKTGNMNIIQKVLQPPFVDAEDCILCYFEDKCDASYSDVKARICSSDLNESQKAAVLSCIGTRVCHHENTVKLIWGPPGTGKTKTVGFLLHSLLRMKCRTLTCAPTNVAVLEVTKRLVKGVTDTESSVCVKYGLGDVVLFGHRKRMKIKKHKDLSDVFLDHRVEVLYQCYDSKFGWNCNLLSMISLLEDPQKQYRLYLREREREAMGLENGKKAETKNLCSGNKNVSRNRKEGNTSDEKSKDERQNKVWKQVVAPHLKENEKNKKKTDDPLTFVEFVKDKFNYNVVWLYFCINNLYIHLPTSHISLEVVKNMFAAFDSLKHFQILLRNVSNEVVTRVFRKGTIIRGNSFTEFHLARNKALVSLKSLPLKFREPYSDDPFADKKMLIRQFCLENACLVFCTASSSAKLHMAGIFELVVIDEAAQLKECESTISLQLPGIRHALLIGDEKQLPAMVQSKVSEEADFGRSLFERLALRGLKKLLLGVQHRMHPSISLFPNQEFYDNKILDGPNVKLGNYSRRFLPGEIYGSYSFINVPHGKEEFNNKHSRKNMVEVLVVSDIVASLYKESLRTKKKVRVGVISPYKAQVHAISERFGKRYSSDAQSSFSVSVRSVDGFQGGEEDVIIISTVRCNVRGSVGFLSNRQRTNVALTRARYCLWIVGSGTTLGNSDSVWKRLIVDAKERNCFYNAEEDQNLAQAIVGALVELKNFDVLATADSLLFRSSRWKVCFTNEFWRSMARAKNDELRRKVFSLLEKLSSGWRQPEKNQNHVVVHDGSSSLFVEHYQVTKQMYLVWAVDILRETSNYTQILKVWDVLPVGKIQNLAGQLDVVFGGYTIDKMSRCTHKFNDRNLVLPMQWSVDSGSQKTDPAQSLSKPMASLSLRDKPETSSTTNSQIRSESKYHNSRSSATNQTWRVSRVP